MDATAGGICQLSSTLYWVTVKANLESQLEHTYLQRPDGTRVPMKKRKD